MTKEIFKDEILKDEQLNQIAGGTGPLKGTGPLQ